MWNKENLISEIDQFDAALQQMRAALVADDRNKLEEMFRLSTSAARRSTKNCPNKPEVLPCPSRKARNPSF